MGWYHRQDMVSYFMLAIIYFYVFDIVLLCISANLFHHGY